MIWLTLILLVLFLMLALLLWAPLELLIDTEKEQYVFKWKGICELQAVVDNAGFQWKAKAFFWRNRPGSAR